MIEIQQGITIGQGIKIGDVFAVPENFNTEDNPSLYFITESGDYLVTESPA